MDGGGRRRVRVVLLRSRIQEFEGDESNVGRDEGKFDPLEGLRRRKIQLKVEDDGRFDSGEVD